MKTKAKKRRLPVFPADPREARSMRARIILRLAGRRLSANEVDELRHVADGNSPRAVGIKYLYFGQQREGREYLFTALETEFAALF